MTSQQTPSFGYSEAFKPAPRKKRSNRPARELPSPSALLQRTMDELAETEWIRDPSASRDARAQLALLLAICEDLHIDRANVSVYDPVFAEADIALLAALGVARLTEDRHGRFRAAAPTVAFMPHCDLQLYENLLRENWAGAGLSPLVLIANRLSDYAESVPARKMSVEYPCVWRLAPHLVSRNLPPCAAYPTAFNNTAVQYARVGDAGDAEDFWELPPQTGCSRDGSDAQGDGGGSV